MIDALAAWKVAREQVCGATLDMLEILPPHVGLRLHLFTLDLLAGTPHVEGGLDPVPVREQHRRPAPDAAPGARGLDRHPA
ncbi:MAG: hypothetical protein R3E96_10510 [Planctomycetota bacterium]